jgi:hypothetical protein
MEVAASNDDFSSRARLLSALPRPVKPTPPAECAWEDAVPLLFPPGSATVGGDECFRRGDVTGERGGE